MPSLYQLCQVCIHTLGAILYSCVSSSLGFLPSGSQNERNSLSYSTSQNSGPRVVLPTATHNTETANVTVLLPTVTPTEGTNDGINSPSGVWGVVTASILNVRETPDINAPVVGTLNAGECVELVTEGEGWYGVTTDTIAGWSSSEFISLVDTCPATPTAADVAASTPAALSPESPPTVNAQQVTDSAIPSYVGQAFAPNVTVAREGWLYECFGQGNNGLRVISAGTPVQLLGVGDFIPTVEQQALLGDGPFYKVRVWDGQYGWLPTWVVDSDPFAYATVPGDCAEYDRIDWTTVVRPDPPTAVPTVAEPLPEWTSVVATPTSIAPNWTPTSSPAPSRSCCKICTKGKACGNSCISRSYTCHKGPGCACNG